MKGDQKISYFRKVILFAVRMYEFGYCNNQKMSLLRLGTEIGVINPTLLFELTYTVYSVYVAKA